MSHRFGFRARPSEASECQAFVKQEKSISLPVQCLHTISAFAVEEEEGVGKGFQLKGFLYHGGQTIYSTAQICVAAGNIDLVSFGKIAQHDFRRRSAMPTVSAYTPL